MSSGLPLAVGVARGDLQVALRPQPKQNLEHPGPCAGTSREPVTEWDAQIEAGAMEQGKSMKKEVQQAIYG
jgi:hypothetical protein